MGAVRRAGIGRYLARAFVHPGQATTGGLLLAYGSGGALMLFLLGVVRGGVDRQIASRTGVRRTAAPVGRGAMLASVALIASGGDRYLQSAGGLSQALEQRLAARLPQPEQKTSLQPNRRAAVSAARCSLAGAAHGSTARR